MLPRLLLLQKQLSFQTKASFFASACLSLPVACSIVLSGTPSQVIDGLLNHLFRAAIQSTCSFILSFGTNVRSLYLVNTFEHPGVWMSLKGLFPFQVTKNKTEGFFNKALAIAMRCFWPPENWDLGLKPSETYWNIENGQGIRWTKRYVICGQKKMQS